MEDVKDAAEDLISAVWPTYTGDLAPALRAIAVRMRCLARCQDVWDAALQAELEAAED